MIKILLFLILFIISCGPSDFINLIGIKKFKVGDCIINSRHEPEKYELKTPNYKIMEVGNRAYFTCYIYKGIELTDHCEYFISYGHLWEDFYQKVPCGAIK